MSDERAQAVTLEATIAGLILLASVLFALQMTAVTPLSASTSSQHIENQLKATADGVLTTAMSDDSLERTILYYNNESGVFINSTYRGYYAGEPPNTTFGRTLETTFDQRGIAYNLYVRYDYDNRDERDEVIYRGEPSDNAVSATTTLFITDDTPLYHDPDDDGVANPRSYSVSNASGMYMRDASASGLYNVVTVEVVVWRI